MSKHAKRQARDAARKAARKAAAVADADPETVAGRILPPPADDKGTTVADMLSGYRTLEAVGSIPPLSFSARNGLTDRNPAAPAAAQPEPKPMEESTDVLKVMVLVSPDGNVITAKGADAEEFAQVSAYATQLATLVGEGLGLEGFRELECDFKRGRCLIYLDSSGNTVGVRPKAEMPMAKVREVLGFQ